MNGMNVESNFSATFAPSQALDELLGDQFVEWLQNFVAAQVKSWPELAAIAIATPKIEKIRKFMLQRFLAHEAFLGSGNDPGFLGFVLANLSESNDPQAESALEFLETKRQEDLSGGKPSHALWIRLLNALGVAGEDIKRTEPKELTRNYIAELSDVYSNSEWQTAMGAFAAQTWAVPVEYEALGEMIKKNAQVSELELAAISPEPINPGHVLDKIVFDKENKTLVWEGVQRQLTARHDLYKGLLKYLES